MLDQPHAKTNGAKPQQEMISGAFLRNDWYVAAWADELDHGRLVPRTIMNEPIVLYRKENGGVAAIEDRCAHRFAPLSWVRSSAATAFSVRITVSNSTAPAPAYAIRTATRTSRRAPE